MKCRDRREVLEVLEQRTSLHSVERQVPDAACCDFDVREINRNIGCQPREPDVRKPGDLEFDQAIGLANVELAIHQVDARDHVGASEVNDAACDANVALPASFHIGLPRCQGGKRPGIARHDIAVVQLLASEPGQLLPHPDVVASMRVADVIEQGRRLVRAKGANRETHEGPFETLRCRER